MGETEINAFLTHLAVEGKVGAAPQTQALADTYGVNPLLVSKIAHRRAVCLNSS